MVGVVSDPCFQTPGNWSVFLLPVHGVLDQPRVRPWPQALHVSFIVLE